jgi:hypothetical protein
MSNQSFSLLRLTARHINYTAKHLATTAMFCAMCLLCGGLVCTDLSGYVSVMWRPGMHRSIWLCVCYVEAWYAPICLVMCLLSGGLVCINLSGYVAICNSAMYPERLMHTRCPHNRHIPTYNAESYQPLHSICM